MTRNQETRINNTTVISNQDGVTLFELIISIAVGSIVIMMLMQMLAMNVTARQHFDYQNRLLNESYNISEKIRTNIFDLQPHSIDIVDTATTTTITISHEYDISVDEFNVVTRVPNLITNVLVYDKDAQTLRYDGVLLHTTSLKIKPGSTITFIDADPDLCAVFPEEEICGQGILRLEFIMTFVISGDNELKEQTYVSTIII